MNRLENGKGTEKPAQTLLSPILRWILVAALFAIPLVRSAGIPTPVQAADTAVSTASAVSTADEPVYTDALASDWVVYPWVSNLNLSATAPVHTGTHSIAVTYGTNWDGLYLHTNSLLETVNYTTINFWVHGGPTGGQAVAVKLADAAGGFSDGVVFSLVKNAWTKVSLPISGFNNAGTELSGLVWQSTIDASQPVFYLDDISLTGSTTPPPPPQSISLSIDAIANVHSISPYIYGMSFASAQLAADLRLPVNRWGGNAVTRYNWQNDTSNHASDWYFENIPNDNANPNALPTGSSSDAFVAQNRSTNTQTLLTVPLIGWTPSLRVKACGFSVTKYGAQQSTDPWMPDCGNGKKPNGTLITGNDPKDTSTAIGPSFVSDWMSHLAGLYGTAASGGVRFYNLDNEPMLWNSTHRDVHPALTTYAELRDKTYQYAAAIKAADPAAKTLGPVLWGWSAYFDSAAQEAATYKQPFLDWYLDQMKAYQTAHGVRILDYLDVHFYPQGGEFTNDVSGAMQALRLRSTRALWDPTYKDESWINDYVKLIPRLHDWVNLHYPGTLTAISEYNWGALNSLNGALTQAEVLGIFGREGLDMAELWGADDNSLAFTDPGVYAFRMYRNYDGNGASFGDASFQAASSDASRLSIFAARRSTDGALTLMVINKTASDLSAPIAISHFSPDTSAQVYRYSGANLKAIQVIGVLPVSQTGIAATVFPANSITLLVVAPDAPLKKVFLPVAKK